MQRALLLSILLLATPLAGCLGGEEPLDPTQATQRATLELADVPAGATLERLDNGLRLVWEDLELPFTQEIEVPPGTTTVRATHEVGTSQVPFVELTHAETDRRRCNVPFFQPGWFERTTGSITCSGLAVVDELPATWEVRAMGPDVADLLSVTFTNDPLDGIAAHVNTANLSMPTHELTETEEVWIESHDGVELYAQVTLPEGQGPWPTVIASSPYNSGYHAAGEPAMWDYFVHDWAKRGYAIVVADVRGFGNSGGCVEVWGPNEQVDQKVLVDWTADQPWSDGHVGFYGQSYVGTTPVAAAVQAPEALDAIIAVAPVINAYDDWHFGGVPNGENLLSPVAYQALTGTQTYVEEDDPTRVLVNNANALCDPTLLARANDPRALYDGFYEERNFSARADQVEAATLYTHGFEDVNVKSQMITHWFNELDVPKLALLGHWVHQHPVRADNELLFLAWMDHHVKGKDMGLDDLPRVDVVSDQGTHRTGESWPPLEAQARNLYPDFGDQALSPTPTDGSTSFLLDPTGATQATGLDTGVELMMEVPETIHLAGQAKVHLRATLEGTENGHVAAFLYEDGADGPRLVTFGMANLAHRDGHDTYQPATPGGVLEMALPFLPTEHTFEAGDTLRLVLRGAQSSDWAGLGSAGPLEAGAAQADRAGLITLEASAQGTMLMLPTLPAETTVPLPLSASP